MKLTAAEYEELARRSGGDKYQEILAKIKAGAIDAAKIQRSIIWNDVLRKAGIKLYPKQLAIYASDIEHMLIAGDGGGGKTFLLAVLLLKYIHLAEHSALGIRKTYGSLYLAGGMLEHFLKLCKGSNAHWNGSDHVLTFPNKASVKFQHLATLGSEKAIDSGQYGTVCVDESAHIFEEQLKFVAVRLRQPKHFKAPLRMRLGSNPGGVAHRYHVENYVEGPLGYAMLSMLDNPYIDAEKYRNTLRQTHGENSLIWKQRALGMWIENLEGSIIPRDMLNILEVPFNVIPGATRVRAWDLGATKKKPGTDPDYAVGTLGHLTGMQLFCVEDVVRGRFGALETDKMIEATAERDGKDVPIIIEQEPGASSPIYIQLIQQKLKDYTVIGVPSTTAKRSRWSPFAAAVLNSMVYVLVGPWNRPWYDEVCSLTDIPILGQHDDQLDSVALAYNQCLLLANGGKPSARRA